MKQFVYTSVN